MQERNERNIFTYYSQYSRDLIECVYASAASSNMKRIFIKKWGNYLTGKYVSTLTGEEKVSFEKYASIFEKYLEIALKLQKKGYNFQKIKAYFLEQTAIRNVSSKRKNELVIYKDVKTYLEKYDMTEKEMMKILDQLSTPKRMCFTYIYGVDRPKKTLEETCEILDSSKTLALAYLKAVEEEFQKFQLNKLRQQNVPPVSQKQTFKGSLFDYCDEKDKEYLLQALKWYSENDITYYDIILKAYGRNYNSLNKSVKFTKEEVQLLSRFVESVLPNSIKSIKSGKSLRERKGCRRKISMYDYFLEEDKDYILERINWWKENNKDYYNLIVKLYGEDYDCLNKDADLSPEERKYMTNIITLLKSHVKNRKNNPEIIKIRKKKVTEPSFYDYFLEEDKTYVLEQINWWKVNNKNYYNLIIKLYGDTYDCLNKEIELSPEESKIMSNIVFRIKGYIDQRKSGKEIKSRDRKRKSSIYDYFLEEDKVYVLERIKWWKIYNDEYYNLIVKLYGETYDQLNEEIELSSEESKVMSNIILGIKNFLRLTKNSSKAGNKRKLSFYDYFLEEDKAYVLERIEWWKVNNKKCYDLIVKLYGETYDYLNKELKLSLEESKYIASIVSNLKRDIKQRKSGKEIKRTSYKRKTSIYDYFLEEDKEYVLERIEWWEKNNKAYYKLIIKAYGETYDCLNKEIELSPEESKTMSNIVSKIKNYIVQRKSGKEIKRASSKRKTSIYDYFLEEDKEYVLERIEWWEKNNKAYYKLIIKAYGETYDCLNKEELSPEESKIMSNIVSRIKGYIDQRKSGKEIKRASSKRKTSIYDYFLEEDKAYVLEQIEWWKENNKDYYKLIIKAYGETYDCLNKEELSPEESKIMSNIVSRIKGYIDQRKSGKEIKRTSYKRKQSFYDYFLEEDKVYVLERIEWWKENNKDYYNLIVKLYGETYDHLKEKINVTSEDSKLMSHSITSLRNYINKKRSGAEVKTKSPKRKQSFYNYFEKADKAYVIERIAYLKENNNVYYEVLVKLYGDTYDTLNSDITLTEEESITFHQMVTSVGNYINRKKRRLEVEDKKQTIEGTPKEAMIILFKSNHFNMPDEKICEYLDITMEELDCSYCKNLHLFGSYIPTLIKTMIVRDKNNVSRILNLSYLSSFLSTLTLKEKIYLQLKLESYANPDLTEDKISKLVGVAVKDLKKYEIMTPYDELNQLNVLLKK